MNSTNKRITNADHKIISSKLSLCNICKKESPDYLNLTTIKKREKQSVGILTKNLGMRSLDSKYCHKYPEDEAMIKESKYINPTTGKSPLWTVCDCEKVVHPDCFLLSMSITFNYKCSQCNEVYRIGYKYNTSHRDKKFFIEVIGFILLILLFLSIGIFFLYASGNKNVLSIKNYPYYRIVFMVFFILSIGICMSLVLLMIKLILDNPIKVEIENYLLPFTYKYDFSYGVEKYDIIQTFISGNNMNNMNDIEKPEGHLKNEVGEGNSNLNYINLNLQSTTNRTSSNTITNQGSKSNPIQINKLTQFIYTNIKDDNQVQINNNQIEKQTQATSQVNVKSNEENLFFSYPLKCPFYQELLDEIKSIDRLPQLTKERIIKKKYDYNYSLSDYYILKRFIEFFGSRFNYLSSNEIVELKIERDCFFSSIITRSSILKNEYFSIKDMLCGESIKKTSKIGTHTFANYAFQTSAGILNKKSVDAENSMNDETRISKPSHEALILKDKKRNFSKQVTSAGLNNQFLSGGGFKSSSLVNSFNEGGLKNKLQKQVTKLPSAKPSQNSQGGYFKGATGGNGRGSFQNSLLLNIKQDSVLSSNSNLTSPQKEKEKEKLSYEQIQAQLYDKIGLKIQENKIENTENTVTTPRIHMNTTSSIDYLDDQMRSNINNSNIINIPIQITESKSQIYKIEEETKTVQINSQIHQINEESNSEIRESDDNFTNDDTKSFEFQNKLYLKNLNLPLLQQIQIEMENDNSILKSTDEVLMNNSNLEGYSGYANVNIISNNKIKVNYYTGNINRNTNNSINTNINNNRLSTNFLKEDNQSKHSINDYNTIRYADEYLNRIKNKDSDFDDENLDFELEKSQLKNKMLEEMKKSHVESKSVSKG